MRPRGDAAGRQGEPAALSRGLRAQRLGGMEPLQPGESEVEWQPQGRSSAQTLPDLSPNPRLCLSQSCHSSSGGPKQLKSAAVLCYRARRVRVSVDGVWFFFIYSFLIFVRTPQHSEASPFVAHSHGRCVEAGGFRVMTQKESLTLLYLPFPTGDAPSASCAPSVVCGGEDQTRKNNEASP